MKTRIFLMISAFLNAALIFTILCTPDRSSGTPSTNSSPQAVLHSPATLRANLAVTMPASISAAENFPPPTTSIATAAPLLSSAAALPLTAARTASPSPREASSPNAMEPAGNPAAISEPETKQVFNPTAAGNFLHFRGISVGLAETSQSRGGEDRSLGVDVSPEPAPSGDGGSNPSPSGISADPSSPAVAAASPVAVRKTPDDDATQVTVTNAAQANAQAAADGFSQEDELFRMKWGWTAYDAARSEARRESGQGSSN